jgi:signal transduction histidine kinase
MPRHPNLLTAAAAGIGLLGVGLWQHFDYQAHRASHLAQHVQHGRALLDAAEAVAIRECRGGRAHPEELALALDETRAAFDLAWLALRSPDGREIAASGTPLGPPDPLHHFEKEFATLQPSPGGRGPFRPGGSGGAITLPPRLLLALATDPAPLRARLAEARSHALVASAALGAAILLVAGLVLMRIRGADLRADLARSEARLAGLDTLRRLGAGLAHETRNPLGAVRGQAERLARGIHDPAEVQRAARAIVEEADRTVARLEEFMLLSRPAALRRGPVAVGGLFDELRLLLEPDLDSAGATLHLACEGATLDADREQLRRLLMNLLLNAIQAVAPGGQVVLRCERQGGTVRLVVEDDGPGIPEALRETLFEPYVSGRPGGTGLGLSIAQRIANDHGFTLRHEPREPRGTRMVLEVG